MKRYNIKYPFGFIWVKEFKNGPSKICGRQPLKNLKYLNRPYHFKCFKGCLPQILLGPFLNILTHIFSSTECEKDTYGDKRYITGCKKCPDNSYTVHRPGYPAKSIKDCKCKKGYEGNPGIGIPCKREYVLKFIASLLFSGTYH